MASPIKCQSGSFDPVKEFIDFKDYLIRKRGGVPSGTPYAKGGAGLVPRATYSDVAQFYASFYKQTWAPPSTTDMGALADFYARLNNTQGLKSALAEWQSVEPFHFLVRTYGTAGAVSRLANLMLNEVPYPEPTNSLFWARGYNYALLRSSMGCVPGSFEIAKEAITDAIKELPDRLRQAADAITPKMPDVRPWADLFQWLTIGGGLFVLYWYVLRPKNRE